MLVDLGDAVANEVSLPFDRISLEMIYRGLYHFYVAHQKGLAIDPIKYFADPENADALRSGFPTMEAHQAKHYGVAKRQQKEFKY